MQKTVQRLALLVSCFFCHTANIKYLGKLMQKQEITIEQTTNLLGDPTFINNNAYYYFFPNNNGTMMQIILKFNDKSVLIKRTDYMIQNNIQPIITINPPNKYTPRIQNEIFISWNNLMSQGKGDQEESARLKYSDDIKGYNLY